VVAGLVLLACILHAAGLGRPVQLHCNSEDALQSFDGLLLRIGMEVDVPPLPRFAVENQIAAVR
jgi:hypothetical protein